MTTTALQAELHEALLGAYEDARARGYYATYFKQMLDRHGGLETARRLLAKQDAQVGLGRLWELGLLEISLEAVVLQERFRPLFTEVELHEARRRLGELGYFGAG